MTYNCWYAIKPNQVTKIYTVVIRKITVEWNKFKKRRNSQKTLTRIRSDACLVMEASLWKGEIRSQFSLHRSTERTLFHAASSIEHMGD